eukprot:838682-Pleurochrysis_carterae.AAC.1
MSTLRRVVRMMSALHGVVRMRSTLWGRHLDVDPLAVPMLPWCMTTHFGSAQMMSTLSRVVRMRSTLLRSSS